MSNQRNPSLVSLCLAQKTLAVTAPPYLTGDSSTSPSKHRRPVPLSPPPLCLWQSSAGEPPASLLNPLLSLSRQKNFIASVVPHRQITNQMASLLHATPATPPSFLPLSGKVSNSNGTSTNEFRQRRDASPTPGNNTQFKESYEEQRLLQLTRLGSIFDKHNQWCIKIRSRAEMLLLSKYLHQLEAKYIGDGSILQLVLEAVGSVNCIGNWWIH